MAKHNHGCGPGLKRLRQRLRLQQGTVGEKLNVSRAAVSRLEREDSNPRFSSVVNFLEAIGASLHDLADELGHTRNVDPLDPWRSRIESRMRDEPSYRRLARDLIDELGGPGRTDVRDLDRRLRAIEAQLAASKQAVADPTDGEPIE